MLLASEGDSDPSHVKKTSIVKLSAISRDVTYPQVVTNEASHLLRDMMDFITIATTLNLLHSYVLMKDSF